MFEAVEQHGQNDAPCAAVEGHAALPDVEDFDRIGEEVGGIVEEHVAEAAAENDAQYRPAKKVIVQVRREDGVAVALGEYFHPVERQNEADDVRQAVPPHRDGAKVEGDGIELRVDEHGGSIGGGYFWGKGGEVRM